MKKILVTGGGGFIGKEICSFFSNNNFKVLSIVRSNFNKEKKYNIKKIDLTKKIKINFSPDIIIHCASEMPTKGETGRKMYNNNIKMMKELLLFAEQKNVAYFFNMSSMSIYGNIKRSPVKVSSSSISPNLYGQSKIINEKLLDQYCYKKKILCISFRLPGVVGKKSHSNFISNSIKILKNHKELKVFNQHSQFNNILLVSDLSKLILKIIFNNKIEKKHYRLNIASKNPIKMYSLINFLKQKLMSKSRIKWVKSKNKSFLINFEETKKLGFIPKTTKQSLRDLVKLF
tara:strand:- start:211 stop:1074 length:864 start_codon:yes stop_codon:yes gene_type:complete